MHKQDVDKTGMLTCKHHRDEWFVLYIIDIFVSKIRVLSLIYMIFVPSSILLKILLT